MTRIKRRLAQIRKNETLLIKTICVNLDNQRYRQANKLVKCSKKITLIYYKFFVLCVISATFAVKLKIPLTRYGFVVLLVQ
jgi:hypothetical protein